MNESTSQVVNQSRDPGNKRAARKDLRGLVVRKGGFTKGGLSPFCLQVFLKFFFSGFGAWPRRGETYQPKFNPKGAVGRKPTAQKPTFVRERIVHTTGE